MAKKKILGWGECSAKIESAVYDDIVEESASLSVEEGNEQEATIEGGKVEGRKQTADKYIIEFDRRIGDENEVKIGLVENAGSVSIVPKNVGAVFAELKGCSRKITIKQDSKNGLVAHYQYKTKGSTDSVGNLDDVELKKSSNALTFNPVETTTGKNPYEEGWYVKDGGTDVYVHAFETTPKDNVTYYTIG